MIIYTFSVHFFKIQYDKDDEDDKGDEDDGDEENEWSAKPITALSNDSGRSRGTKLQVRPLGKYLSSDDEDCRGHHNRFNCLLVGGL